jgi:hypothetical protein
MSNQVIVTLGDKQYPIQRFRGLKAILVMASVARISREVPDIMNDAIKDFQSRHTITVTEGMSRLPRFAAFSTEDFDAAETRTGKREIEIPAVMTNTEQFMQSLPKLLEEARTEVIRLFAILIIPQMELKAADKSGNMEAKLDDYTDILMDDAEIDQLADLVFAARDVLSEQLGDRSERLGKMMEGLMNLVTGRTTVTSQMTPVSPTIPEPSESSTPQTSSDAPPTSSTDSDASTDGVEPKPSTESPG